MFQAGEISPKHRVAWVLSGVIFVVALYLYGTTAAPGLTVGGLVESETAQLQRAAYRLGIAHSTGYPLHTLLGYIAGYLADHFGQNPYTWITYTSVVASALGMVLVFNLLTHIGHAPIAFAATLAFMVTDNIWHISTITETQALNLACIAGLWWLTVVYLEHPNHQFLLWGMAFLTGVGLANHRTSAFAVLLAGLAVLSGGTWRHWSWRQWGILLVLAILPLLSYGYLFWRATDPHVAYSTRPTWFPAMMDNQQVWEIIRGTLQSGEGLEGNLRLPTEDYPDRFDFVWQNLIEELSQGGVWLGLVGLGIWSGFNWRRWGLAVVYLASWTLFLMSWRLDWKSIIYMHGLTLPLIMGWVVLATWPHQAIFARFKARYGWLTHPVLLAIASLPILWFGLSMYQENRPLRDLSQDTLGTQYYAEMALLPADTWLYSGGWTPDTFILLEYLDSSGRQDILPQGDFNAELVAESAYHTERNVIISPATRGFFGLYSGSPFFHERGLAFSGTAAPSFFQIRPPDDPCLQVEADAGQVVQHPITPEIALYSYTLWPEPDQLRITLFWQAVEAVPVSYSVFTHLREYGVACERGELRRLLAQDDSFGTVRNMHPTQWWQAGEIVKDTYFIPWEQKNLPNGASLVVGMSLNGQTMGEFCLPIQPALMTTLN